MLEGLFGSGFKTKCKWEIKSIKARIEVARRRAEAQKRFLKEDLAKLLVNGLDHDAFARTEEYLALQNILDSYDFVEQTCEHIKGQLSYMQKLRECPEDCREAVGSLIFAAARFSDLPELRDLRDLLKQRYGNSLENFVNQKFLEKLSSKPPEKETKMKLLKDIATEHSLKWDVKGFEQRMAPPSATTQLPMASHIKSELAGDINQMRRSERGTFNTREDNIPEPSKEDVLRHGHRHANGGEIKYTVREGFKRDCRTPEWDRRDATKQRLDLDKAKDQARPGSEKKSEVASDGGKLPRSAEGTFHTRVDNTQEPNTQEVNRQRHRYVNDGDKKHRSSMRDATRHANDCENERSDREGFIREYCTPETGRRESTKQRPELDKSKDQALQGTDVEYLRRNKPIIHNPKSNMEGRHEILLPNGEETEAADNFRSSYAKEDTFRKTMRSRRSQDAIKSENVDTGFMIHNNGNSKTTPFHGQSLVERQDITSVPNYRSERDVERLRTDALGENSILAPPYSRSKNSKLPPKTRDSNHRSSRGSRHETSVSQRPFMDPSFHNRDHHAVDFSGRIQKEADQCKHEKERAELILPRTHYPEEFDHDHNGMIPLPKPRGIRRKHRRSLTHENLVGISEDAGAIRRSSNSRRKEHSRKGLQISSDDEKPKGDKEEKTIDKMLLHYCKKPSSYGTEKPRPKHNDHHAEKNTLHAGESSGDDKKSEHIPWHTRSFSVPSNHEDIKAFTRVKSLQPDDHERHVHPKLPDYDDFVARLAALRGR